MTDIQCEKCGWIGDESLYTPAAPMGTADLICPACEQVCEGWEVDWKERCGHAENDLADVRRDLAAAVDRVIASNERAKVAEAEVAGWRRAVRWVEVRTTVNGAIVSSDRFELRMQGIGDYNHAFAAVWNYCGNWVIDSPLPSRCDPLPDRNTACAKVCELLGIPTVLPGGE